MEDKYHPVFEIFRLTNSGGIFFPGLHLGFVFGAPVEDNIDDVIDRGADGCGSAKPEPQDLAIVLPNPITERCEESAVHEPINKIVEMRALLRRHCLQAGDLAVAIFERIADDEPERAHEVCILYTLRKIPGAGEAGSH